MTTIFFPTFFVKFQVQNILKLTQAELAALLRPVGFFNNKAKYLLTTCNTLLNDYECDIPPTFEGLIKLPGVGPKMAYLVMDAGWKQNQGLNIYITFSLFVSLLFCFYSD